MICFRLAMLLVCGALAACQSSTDGGIKAELRRLDADDPWRSRLGNAEVLSVHQLRGPAGFGGISGLSYDGATVTAVNDSGHWLRFAMTVDPAGRPHAFGDLEMGRLGGCDGGKSDGDAEEVLRTEQGWLVSFEHRHRLAAYGNDFSAPPHLLELPSGYGEQPANGGVEAMAGLADGRLLLLSEDAVDVDGSGLGWIGRSGDWHRLRYQRTGDFQPTAAAQMPDGDLLVLERRFHPLSGVAIRLSRVAKADLRPEGVLRGSEIFVLASPFLVDNYEGLAVRRRDDGRVVAYLLADDNFNPVQATLLMAVVLP